MTTETALPPDAQRLLGIVWDHGPLTTTQVAERANLTLAVCKDRLARLQDLGLVRRQGVTWEGPEATEQANPRLDAMRQELVALDHRRNQLTPDEIRRGAILEQALLAYRTDAELERAEREARAADYTDGGPREPVHGDDLPVPDEYAGLLALDGDRW